MKTIQCCKLRKLGKVIHSLGRQRECKYIYYQTVDYKNNRIIGPRQEVPTKTNPRPSPSLKKKKQKMLPVLDPPHLIVMQILDQPSNPFHVPVTNLPGSEDTEPGPESVDSPESENQLRSTIGNLLTDTGSNANAGTEYDAGMGFFKPPPSDEETQLAFNDIKRILHLPRKTAGYKDAKLDTVFHWRLEGMKQFLWTYIDPQSVAYRKWTMASLLTARALEQKPAYSRVLCK